MHGPAGLGELEAEDRVLAAVERGAPAPDGLERLAADEEVVRRMIGDAAWRVREEAVAEKRAACRRLVDRAADALTPGRLGRRHARAAERLGIAVGEEPRRSREPVPRG